MSGTSQQNQQPVRRPGEQHISITIDAPVEVVWSVFTDVERWPTWTASGTTTVATIHRARRLAGTCRRTAVPVVDHSVPDPGGRRPEAPQRAAGACCSGLATFAFRHRHRRVSERRDALLRRVVAAAADGGLARRSLRDLAAHVGTSHRMLIHHFGSRDGLLAAVVDAVERCWPTPIAWCTTSAACPTVSSTRYALTSATTRCLN